MIDFGCSAVGDPACDTVTLVRALNDDPDEVPETRRVIKQVLAEHADTA